MATSKIEHYEITCDVCGKIVLQTKSPVHELPEGWIELLHYKKKDRNIYAEKHHFCGVDCLYDFTSDLCADDRAEEVNDDMERNGK